MRTIAWLVFATACSGGSGSPTKPTKPTPVAADAGVAVAPALTTAECEQLIAHAVDLALVAADPPPNDAEKEKAKAAESLRSLTTECGSLTRESFRCGMDATTLAALSACHATFNSSTSNSKVAPPGITPPAPRSP